MSSLAAIDELGSGENWKEVPIRRAPKSRRKFLALVTLGVVVVGLGVVLYNGLTSALVYFYTAQQALAMRHTLGTSTFRMEGVVQRGTITPTTSGVNFTVRFDRSEVRVIETGAPPQLFQPNIPVVVVGHFSGTTFLSDQIMIKHSANYVAAHPSRISHPGGN